VFTVSVDRLRIEDIGVRDGAPHLAKLGPVGPVAL
jgi:hypothetical protein